jgi:hypothetical protein
MINDDIIKHLPLKVEDDPIYLGQIDGYTMAAPNSFWTTSYDLKRDIINGCGPGGIGDFLIPDRAYFLDLKPACKIHDWMFTVYNCEKGFELSNTVFLDNMNRINQVHSGNVFYSMRKARIKTYYRAVRDLGRLFYYDAHVGIYNGDDAIMAI